MSDKPTGEWAQKEAERLLPCFFNKLTPGCGCQMCEKRPAVAQALREARAQGQAQSHADCELGEPLMHGPQPYPWCGTHNHLMMACDMRFRGQPALDVEAASREVAAMTEFALCARPLSVIEHEIAAILARHFRADESRAVRIEQAFVQFVNDGNRHRAEQSPPALGCCAHCGFVLYHDKHGALFHYSYERNPRRLACANATLPAPPVEGETR